MYPSDGLLYPPVMSDDYPADSKRETEHSDARSDLEKDQAAYGVPGVAEKDVLTVDEINRAERKVHRKLDAVILPLTALLYLSAYLDRGNIGNARLQGLQSELLHGSDTKYSVVLLSFYITYIVFSIPGTLLAKAILPSTAISLGCLIWSLGASGMAGAHSYGSIIACRLFIGLGESLFGQSVALYYSLWYKKDEIAIRVAFFIGAGVTSGAFGGLIAFGVQHITNSISTWRILFLLEGMPSFLLAVCVFLFLPSRPDMSKYLTERERTVWIARLNTHSLGEGGLGIDWRGANRAFLDWKTYVIAILYSCMNLTLSSLSGFLPTIITTLGYSNARAQLFTVPPYAVALVVMLLLNYVSDRMQTRGIFVAIVFIINLVGWIILLAIVHNQHARYFACFCITIGGYAAIPLIISWTSNNSGSQSQRGVTLGMLNSLGQFTSIVSPFIFPTNEAPAWHKGFGLNLAFSVLAIIISLGMSVYYRMENRRRDIAEGGPPPEGVVLDVVNQHDLAPGFRYVV